jgi:hypothetical protein
MADQELLDAATSGQLEAARAALEAGADINTLGPGRATPLILAAAAGHLAVVELLLSAGAEPGWRDEGQETALLKAAANGHGAVAAVLAPHAEEDDRDLARAFLAAYGHSHGPAYQYDASSLKRGAVTVAARAAAFVGHEDPLHRVERVDRAESLRKKK